MVGKLGKRIETEREKKEVEDCEEERPTKTER